MIENKVRASLAQTFLDALKENQLPWHKCWSAAPMSFSTGKAYRGINNLLLSFTAMEKGYQDTRWLTYNQAQNHGWQVRKGEHSVKVEYWHYYDTKLKTSVDRSEIPRIQREDPERMKDIRLSAYSYNVFNAEQIDGIPPQEKDLSPINLTLLSQHRDTLLQNLGVALREGGDRAYYSPESDIITMPFIHHFSGEYSYLCTLLHEAGHATGHHTRLNRPLYSRLENKEAYAQEELRAEIASAFTAQALNISYPTENMFDEMNNHKAYIQSWISLLENDPNELFHAIKDAEKISDYLLENGKLLELSQAPRQTEEAFPVPKEEQAQSLSEEHEEDLELEP